jgi:hypothetical protein
MTEHLAGLRRHLRQNTYLRNLQNPQNPLLKVLKVTKVAAFRIVCGARPAAVFGLHHTGDPLGAFSILPGALTEPGQILAWEFAP